MQSPLINCREDLDAIQETNPQAYADFMLKLKGTMSRRTNVAVYPEGYGQPDYTGPAIDPIWEDVEDLSVIESFGFTAADFA